MWMGVALMRAAEIMNREILTIRGSARVAEAIALMQKRGWRSLIVDRQHEEDAYGIVTETDVVQKVIAFGKDPQHLRVYEIMTKPCIVVNPNLQVEYVARLFTNTGIRSAPVIEGQLLGVISMQDILTKGDFVARPQAVKLQEQIETAIAHANQICADSTRSRSDCLTAWSLVEDLQAEVAYQESEPLPQTALEEFLEQNPDWISSAEAEAWCSG